MARGGPVSGRVRVEVTDRYGTVAEIFDPDELPHVPPRERGQLDALAAGLVRDLAQVLGSREDHARQVAIALLMRLQADEAAYARIAESKGLLPL